MAPLVSRQTKQKTGHHENEAPVLPYQEPPQISTVGGDKQDRPQSRTVAAVSWPHTKPGPTYLPAGLRWTLCLGWPTGPWKLLLPSCLCLCLHLMPWGSGESAEERTNPQVKWEGEEVPGLPFTHLDSKWPSKRLSCSGKGLGPPGHRTGGRGHPALAHPAGWMGLRLEAVLGDQAELSAQVAAEGPMAPTLLLRLSPGPRRVVLGPPEILSCHVEPPSLPPKASPWLLGVLTLPSFPFPGCP
jgi:hypothetical protein